MVNIAQSERLLSLSTASTLPREVDFDPAAAPALVGERLTTQAFNQLAGRLGGYPFVKVVVDRRSNKIHFLNNTLYQFHADYIGDHLLKIPRSQLEADIDAYNQSFYFDPDREFFLGILALHTREDQRFYSLETVEVDTMDAAMVQEFHRVVKSHVDPAIPVLFKPANHLQEKIVVDVDASILPRVFAHELFARSEFIALNPGRAQGRLRAFRSEKEYIAAAATIEWFDIIVMERVPDDIPRVSGIINAKHTTPLSHTNVLASGWQVPNAIQIGVFDRIEREGLDQQWVDYAVQMDAAQVFVKALAERPAATLKAPSWSVQKIKIEEPETMHTEIVSLDQLRMSDRYKYGTKAANLGELAHVLRNGSERLIAFYRIPRPPRANLMTYLARQLGVPEHGPLAQNASDYLRSLVKIPRGIAIPFSVQQAFLCSSPKIQQAIGKLKMALELNVRQIDALCINLQQLIRSTRIPDSIRGEIDLHIARHLGGVSSFVVRSSSNAEDLEHFSAAGIYESINHVTTAENIFESIKTVWASLLSPRSVRLRQEVGISLDDSYMGVVVQEEVKSSMGGVLVTTNPMNRADFRNVYLNISPRSVVNIVQGSELPLQYLYNTVEGGGRTLSIGDAKTDLNDSQKEALGRLALAGRLLQSHFSPDYTFSMPVDIEWLFSDEQIYILQLRPYAK